MPPDGFYPKTWVTMRARYPWRRYESSANRIPCSVCIVSLRHLLCVNWATAPAAKVSVAACRHSLQRNIHLLLVRCRGRFRPASHGLRESVDESRQRREAIRVDYRGALSERFEALHSCSQSEGAERFPDQHRPVSNRRVEHRSNPC